MKRADELFFIRASLKHEFCSFRRLHTQENFLAREETWPSAALQETWIFAFASRIDFFKGELRDFLGYASKS